MLIVALVTVVVLGIWGATAVGVALLAGGMIHARDHLDLPYGGVREPRPVVSIR